MYDMLCPAVTFILSNDALVLDRHDTIIITLILVTYHLGNNPPDVYKLSLHKCHYLFPKINCNVDICAGIYDQEVPRYDN